MQFNSLWEVVAVTNMFRYQAGDMFQIFYYAVRVGTFELGSIVKYSKRFKFNSHATHLKKGYLKVYVTIIPKLIKFKYTCH